MSEATARSRGELVLVATPIGNLGDLSARAASTLEAADVVCCEDTRRTGLLLDRLGLRAKCLLSLHAHNERRRLEELLELLDGGAVVAIVSDAGTPALSDPGALVVRAAIDAGHRVTAVPGPSAVVTAVVLAGFGTARWRYEGFLPRKGRERAARLAEIAASPCPSVLYEAPRRVAETLGDLKGVCGPERRVAICREMTKLHEETWRGTLATAAERAAAGEARGEHVLVVDGAPAGKPAEAADLAEAVAAAMRRGATRREAAAAVAESFGTSRRAAYQSSLEAEAAAVAVPGGSPGSGAAKAR